MAKKEDEKSLEEFTVQSTEPLDYKVMQLYHIPRFALALCISYKLILKNGIWRYYYTFVEADEFYKRHLVEYGNNITQ